MKKNLNHILKNNISKRNHIIGLQILLLILVTLSNAVTAQLYPDAYLEEAINNNPGLKAQMQAYEAEMQQTKIVSTLPDPQLTAGIYTPPMSRLMGNQWFDIGVMQMFPWFGTLSKQKSAAQILAQRIYHQYRDERNTLFLEITNLWLNIHQKEQQIILIEQFDKLLKAREDLIYSRYESGQQGSGLTLDIYRLEIQISELKNRKEKLNEEKIALIRSFNLLTGREELATVETPQLLSQIDSSVILESEDTSDFVDNPKLNMAQSFAESAKIQQEISKLKTLPMIGIGIQYSYFAEGDPGMGQMDGGHMVMPMISVNLPIYGRKNKAIKQKAVLIANVADYGEMNQLNKLQVEWAKLQASLKNLQRDYNFYTNQLEITYKTWNLVLARYGSGEEGFEELLRIQNQLLELEWRILETKVQQYMKLAESDMLKANNIFK
jgi:outer membrane protein, heavy metal efflux system